MMKRKILILGAATAAMLAGTAFVSSDSAEAAIQCRGRVSGQGSGMGIAGQGTTLARSNALADWGRNVTARHGARFANTSLARSVRYDCRQGAILEAKCVVTAVACGDVPVRRKARRGRR